MPFILMNSYYGGKMNFKLDALIKTYQEKYPLFNQESIINQMIKESGRRPILPPGE